MSGSRNASRIFVTSLLLFFALLAPGAAHALSVDEITQILAADAQNNLVTQQATLEGYWEQPSSYDSVYCGDEENKGFDQIEQALGNGALPTASKVVQSVFYKKCSAKPQPLTSSAQQACQPFIGTAQFNKKSLDQKLADLMRNPDPSQNFCNGQQMQTPASYATVTLPDIGALLRKILLP